MMTEANFYKSYNEDKVDSPAKVEKDNIPTPSEEKETQLPKKTKLCTKEGYGGLVANHYNSIADKGLDERTKSRIVYMRNFNNWVKSFLIAKFLDLIRENSTDEHKIIALDLGAGKGGDLIKWQKGQIRHLICADIAGDSISQCKERYENNRNTGRKYTAEFITTDCTKSRLKLLMEVPDTKLDIVSCQFVLHYSFESLSQAETMIRNASESLRKGGYFVATFPDAYKIMSLLESAVDKRTFKNEVFEIAFPEDRPENPKLFGDKYHFFLEGVVNCPEFLVHFPTLVRICKKYGLEVVYKKTFEEIYGEGIKDRDAKSLLFRMRALEMYPANDNEKLSSPNEEEYFHAKEYMEESNTKCVKTISKSEWEAICIYMAVAFKKVT